MLRDPSPQHHVRERLDHLRAAHPPLDSDCQAFTRILIRQRQKPQRSSVVRSGADKIMAPDVVSMLRPQPHTGAAVQPEPSSGPLFLRHFQTFPPPDSLHPILPHRPTRALQQRRDSSIAVPPVLRRQSHHRSCQLPQQPAGAPLRQAILPPRTLHRTTSPLRAQKFPWATSRFNRVFSFSSSFSRFA